MDFLGGKMAHFWPKTHLENCQDLSDRLWETGKSTGELGKTPLLKGKMVASN